MSDNSASIVPGVVSLCAMNLYLHGIGTATSKGLSAGASAKEDPPVDRADALAQPSGRKFDMILANPPFGKKGGYTIAGDDGKISTEYPSALAHHQRRSHTAWSTTSRQKQEYERDELRLCRYPRSERVARGGLGEAAVIVGKAGGIRLRPDLRSAAVPIFDGTWGFTPGWYGWPLQGRGSGDPWEYRMK